MLTRLPSPTSPPAVPTPGVNELLGKLTPAERLVAVHIRQGLSNKEIAQALGKAPGTVKAQVAAILRKFGVCSRARLLARWMTEGAPQF